MNNKAYKKYLEELKANAEIGYSKNPSERSYKERCDIWYYEQALDPDPESWDEGEDVEIYDGESLVNNKIKNLYDDSDFPEWFRELGNHFGEKIKLSHDKEIYTLIGVDYTYVDYYYILQDKEGKKVYSTCVEQIEFV